MMRAALVIGVSAYAGDPLPNAAADARRAAGALERRGFRTTLLQDCTTAEIDAALAAFEASLSGADIAVAYLAGHGVEHHGAGYFLGLDFPLPVKAGRLSQLALSLNDVARSLRPARSAVLIFDACRNWPADGNEATDLIVNLNTLRRQERYWDNLLVAYSTSASDTARDGPPGRSSAYCEAFCELVLRHDLSIGQCFEAIGQHVLHRSGAAQRPWTYSSLNLPVSFSDLPSFVPLHRIVVPNSLVVSAWLTPDHWGEGVYAGVGNTRAWHVDLAGAGRVLAKPDEPVVGLADLGPGRQFLIDGIGRIYRAGAGSVPVFETALKPAFGIRASPGRTGFTAYGERSFMVFAAQGQQPELRIAHRTGFGVYCCAYLSEDLLWVAGERGSILEVDLKAGKVAPSPLAELGEHINVLAPGPNTVFCAGQRSLLVEIDRRGGVVRELLRARLPQTAAGIRAALDSIADEEVIRAFIFEPDRLRPDAREELLEALEPLSLLSCSHAPGLPLVAVGTGESTLLIFDARDGQILQEIEVSTGLPGRVEGVVFISDALLAVIAPEGQVLFLAAASRDARVRFGSTIGDAGREEG